MSEEYFPNGICGYCGTALDESGQCPAHVEPVVASEPGAAEAQIVPPSDFPIGDNKWNDLSRDEQWQEYRSTRVERDTLQAEIARLEQENAALKIENRRVWDGFSVYYKVTGFEPDKRKVYIKGTVHGQSLLANDDDGTYTALWTLANEYASKKIEFGWVD